MSELERAAAQRKAKLDENSAFLQFNWKADVVESWIGENTQPRLSSSPQTEGTEYWMVQKASIVHRLKSCRYNTFTQQSFVLCSISVA